MTSLAAEPPMDNAAENHPLVSAVLLTFDPDTQSLLATLEPSPSAHKIDLSLLQALLQAQGYGEFYTSNTAMHELIIQANQGKDGSKVIANRRDAELKWLIHPNKMAVYLTATPANCSTERPSHIDRKCRFC